MARAYLISGGTESLVAGKLRPAGADSAGLQTSIEGYECAVLLLLLANSKATGVRCSGRKVVQIMQRSRRRLPATRGK